jgi:hypothetical protein
VGNVGIGSQVITPAAKLEVRATSGPGSTSGNTKLLFRIGGSGGTANHVMNNHWLLRDEAGSSWTSIRFHDGLSVDASYLTPKTDTRTWWERDPNNNIQSWGNANSTYLTINNGSVGIGTTNPGSFKLAVEGIIGAREVQVTTANPWPDYVFSPAYKLRPLFEVEQYINANSHLPDVPSAREVKENGLKLGEMDAILLKKIEELTLYMIDLKKENETLKQRIGQLEQNK